MVFVTDQGAAPGTVTVIDGNDCSGAHLSGCKDQPLTTVRVGGGASGVGVNPATNTVYVANTGEDPNKNPVPDGNTLSVIDGASCTSAHPAGCTPVGLVRVGVSPAAVAADPVTNTIYVTNTGDGTPDEGTVSVVDGATCDGARPSGCKTQTAPQVTVGSDPIGLAVDDRVQSVFVANGLDDTASVLDAATCNATQRSGCGERPPTITIAGGPTWPVVDAARHTLYVANQVTNDIAVLGDGTCGAATSLGCRHPVPTAPGGSFPNAAGADWRYATVYIGDANGFTPPSSVAMIDASRCNATVHSGCGTTPASFAAPGSPSVIDVNQWTDTVYMATNESLGVIAAATCNAQTSSGCAHMARVPAGGYALAVDPTTDTIYTGNNGPDGRAFVNVIDGRHCQPADISGCATQAAASVPKVSIGHNVGWLGVDSITHTQYAINIGDHTVSVIDTRHCHAGDESQCANQVPPTVTVPGVSGPLALAVDDATHTAYVTDALGSFTPGAVSIIDTLHCRAGDASQCATQTPPIIATPAGPGVVVRIDPSTDTVYVVNNNDSSVTVIDGRRCNASTLLGCAALRQVEVGSAPSDLALDAQTHTAYAPNFHDNDVSVFGLIAQLGP